MPTRTANAEWNGTLREGNGTLRMASGSYEGPFTFESRFKEGQGTNPEELIASAHAGCFSMQLSAEIAQRGGTPESAQTEGQIEVSGRTGITKSHLVSRVRASGIDQAAFEEAVQAAKENCPVSRALTGIEITVDAKLES